MDKHEGCCGLEDRRGNNSEMVETIRLLNSWVQSVLVLPQLKPPNPSLFEYGGKDFIHPSPLRIPPIQNYRCNQSMPAHRLIIYLSTLRNPYRQSNVNLSSIHTFPEQLQSIYLARPSVPIFWHNNTLLNWCQSCHIIPERFGGWPMDGQGYFWLGGTWTKHTGEWIDMNVFVQLIAEGGWMGWSALNKWRSACSWLGWTALTGTGH